MLKFIRKFQLVILAVGGSLLMVVFLLEPVLTSFQKSQANRTVARLADGSKVSLMEFERARVELELARRVAPAVFLPKQQQGLGLTADAGQNDEHVYHWLLLASMAEKAGLVGGAEDGRALIDLELRVELAEAVQGLGFQVQQGVLTPEEAMSELNRYETARRAQIEREVAVVAASTRGATEDDLWRALAKFTGAYRLMRLYVTTPAFSPAGAMAGLKNLYDSVAVDAVLIPGSALSAGVPDPTEEQLLAFFEPRAALEPGEAEDGIGYAQPARIRLGWLVLDRGAISASVPADRVEIIKQYELDRQRPEADRRYPADIDTERPNIERDLRQSRTDQLMVEADRIIRSEVLRATRTLHRENGLLHLPENWSETRPRLADVAETVVARLREQGVPIRTPEVTIRDDAWLRTADLDQLPIGRTFFRAGSRTIMTRDLPGLFDQRGFIEPLSMQVGVPQADPAAQDAAGNRYYLVVLDHRPAGPARSIEDAGRERVVSDYKSVEGFRRLTEQAEALASAARQGGVQAAVDAALADAGDAARPTLHAAVRVNAQGVAPSVRTRFIDPRLNAEPFRKAVLDAAAGIDPLTPPEALDADPRVITVPLPAARAVAVARLIAPRPLTREEYLSAMPAAIDQLGGRMLRDGIEATNDSDPFTYESLRKRFGLLVLDAGEDV